LAWFFGSLVVSYWNYFDMGVSGARGFVVLVSYFPVSLIVFLLLGTAIHFSLRGCGVGPWLGLAAGVSAMLVVLLAGFGYEVYRLRDYPIPPESQHSMKDFIVWFLRSGLTRRCSQPRAGRSSLQLRVGSNLIQSQPRSPILCLL
jgi:hypothetical protein